MLPRATAILLLLCPTAAGVSTTTPATTPLPLAVQADAIMRNTSRMCTPENELLANSSFPCDMNAGQITSVPIMFGLISVFISGLLVGKVHGESSHILPTEEDGPWQEQLHRFMSQLRTGLAYFHVQTAMFIGAFVFIIFSLLLVVFSANSGHDATDGIRLAACFFIGALVAFTCAWISCYVSIMSMVATSRAAHGNNTADCSQAVTTGGIFSAFFSLGFSFVMLSVVYLLMTLGRNVAGVTVFGQSCVSHEVMCSRVLAAEALAAFATGFATCTLVLRCLAGEVHKGSEVGTEMLGQVIPASIRFSGDQMQNPSTLMLVCGLFAVEVSGVNLELVETVILTVVASMMLAQGDADRLAMPVWCVGWILVASVAGCGLFWYLSKSSHTGEHEVYYQSQAIMRAFRLSLLLMLVLVFIFVAVGTGILYTTFPEVLGGPRVGWRLFACLLTGWLIGFLVIESTAYYTTGSPQKSVAAAGITGPGTIMIQGIGIGLISMVFPIVLCGILLVICNAIAGQYGICMGTLGYLFPTAMAIAFNSILPVAVVTDVAVFSGVNGDQDVAGALCIAGQRASGIVRGFSAPASILSSFCVLAAMKQELGMSSIGGTHADSIGDPIAMAGVLFGACLPFVFSGLNVVAIGTTTQAAVEKMKAEFERQRRPQNSEHQQDEPDVKNLVSGPVLAAARGTAFAIISTVLLPSMVGFWMGPRVLIAFIAGSICGGGTLAIFCQNAGSIWRNSKTTMEVDESYGGPSSPAYYACNVADLVGGSLKDCAAPLCICLMKSMSLVSLLIAPLIRIDLTRISLQECLITTQQSSCFDWMNPYFGIIPSILFIGISAYQYVFFWRRDVSGPVEEHDAETEPQNRMDGLLHHHFGALGHGMTEESPAYKAQPQQVRRAESPAAVPFGSEAVTMQEIVDHRVESTLGYGSVHPGMVTMLSSQGRVLTSIPPYQPALLGPPMVAQMSMLPQAPVLQPTLEAPVGPPAPMQGGVDQFVSNGYQISDPTPPQI